MAFSQWLVIYVPSVPLKLFGVMWGNAHIAALVALKPTAMQLITPNRMRGQVAAIALLSSNLIGYGTGATAIALVTDYIFRDSLAVGHSIMLVGTIGYAVGGMLLWLSFKAFKRLSGTG